MEDMSDSGTFRQSRKTMRTLILVESLKRIGSYCIYYAYNVHNGGAETFKTALCLFQQTADSTERMARAKRASHTRAGTDRDAPIPEPPGGWPATSSRRRRRNHTNSPYAHDSSSSLLLADDEDSLAGSLDEADGELRCPLCPVQHSQSVN